MTETTTDPTPAAPPAPASRRPAKKRPARKTTQPTTRDAPPPGSINGLDLDSLEREGDVPLLYTFRAGGRSWSCKDPREIDWLELMSVDLNDTVGLMRMFLGEEQFAEFTEVKLPAWKVDQLADAVNQHYNGIPDQGEGSGLPPS